MLRKPPIFVLGSPRSGTTLLRLMLTCHRGIAIPPECGFAVWWMRKYQDWTLRDLDTPRLEEFLRDLVSSRKFDTWRQTVDAVRESVQLSQPQSYAQLVSSVYGSYAQRHKPSAWRWGDKNNFHVKHVEQLATLFPDASFIHVVRDGRDVACSYLDVARSTYCSPYKPQLPASIERIAADWCSALMAVESARTSLGIRVHSVRFEELVKSPAAVLGVACAAIQEDYDPEMLQYHSRNATDALEPPETMEWKASTTSAPDSSKIGRYQSELTGHQIALFESIAGDAMARFGY